MIPPLESERLRLRPWTALDVDLVHELWTDPEVRRYLWEGETIARKRAAEALRLVLDEGLGMWSVLLKREFRVAGFCGFRRFEANGEPELIYGFYPQYWGRGYATEACRAAVAYGVGERGYERIHAGTDAENLRSIRLLRRLGMRRVERARAGGHSLLHFVLKADGGG